MTTPWTRLLPLILAFVLSLASPALAGPFMFGVNADNWKGEIDRPGFTDALKALGVEFIVWHLSPEEEVGPGLGKLVGFCRKNNFAYAFNTELVNYVPGVPYFQNNDGTYRWDIRAETLSKLENDPLFLGQVYDEPMLMQSLNGEFVNGQTIQPYFTDTRGMTPDEAFEAVSRKIGERSKKLGSYGKMNVFEMVFPDYAAAPARGGAILAPKILKETPADLMFAVYAGAARQYDARELWACVDLWFLDRFPDKGKFSEGFHTPDNLYEALCYVYTAGFDRAYVEHLKGLVDLDTCELTEYGEAVVRFQQAKHGLDRTPWREFKPSLVVKRFPDGYWGQKYSPFLANHPFGTKMLTTARDEADDKWLRLLSKESNGKLPEDANNWNALTHPYFSSHAYFLKAGLPPMLVVDHTFDNPGMFPGARFIDLTQ